MLVNLSFVSPKPTGISTYAINLIPHLQKLQPTLLSSRKIDDRDCYLIPANLTPDSGSKGHLRRLWWTQQQLPKIYKQKTSHLLFSPVPEAPLFTDCRYIVTVHDLIPLRFAKFSPPDCLQPLLYPSCFKVRSTYSLQLKSHSKRYYPLFWYRSPQNYPDTIGTR